MVEELLPSFLFLFFIALATNIGIMQTFFDINKCWFFPHFLLPTRRLLLLQNHATITKFSIQHYPHYPPTLKPYISHLQILQEPCKAITPLNPHSILIQTFIFLSICFPPPPHLLPQPPPLFRFSLMASTTPLIFYWRRRWQWTKSNTGYGGENE